MFQISTDKDFVLYLACTPETADSEVCEEPEGIFAGENLIQRRSNLNLRPKCLNETDNEWVASHATQVKY